MAESLMNTPKSTLTEFLGDLEGRLMLLTGVQKPEDYGLTLEMVRHPILVIGQPGMGKTCGIQSIIKRLNDTKLKEMGIHLGFKKILLGQTVVGSMTGIPVIGHDGKVVRVQMPDLPDPERDGEYGVLFLDEITTADEAQVQPALGLTDGSRNIGEYTLPEHWIVIGAGNGPDCANFVRLDDMTISRFSVYDIAYDFATDWRPYALSHGINDNIIAFLNFAPEAAMNVESTDMDDNGKLFACPRTWEALSNELKMREALGKPVNKQELGRFCGRHVGINAARRFQSFCECIENVQYDPEKIADGVEKDPDSGMKKEVFFSVLQRCTKYLMEGLEDTDDGTGVYSEYCYTAVGNTLKWFLKFQNYDLDATITAIFQLRNDAPRIKSIMLDDKFSEYCPEIDDFCDEYASLILGIADSLNMNF